jgi:hypothetical protein
VLKTLLDQIVEIPQQPRIASPPATDSSEAKAAVPRPPPQRAIWIAG